MDDTFSAFLHAHMSKSIQTYLLFSELWIYLPKGATTSFFACITLQKNTNNRMRHGGVVQKQLLLQDRLSVNTSVAKEMLDE